MPFSQYIPHIAAFLASVPGLIGIKGLLQPRELIAQVEFPAPPSAEAALLSDALTRLMSARNLTISLLALAVYYKGDRKLQGWTMIILSLFPAIDGYVSYHLIGGGLANHLPVVPVSIGLGLALLR
ncbi:hypothetical protein E8E14_013340 [Neopestalotiopsis sp. 37M]|jgi:hypothetical protein|nr:hypothetical protein E8E14_013340 [Neopestalotiopsis sp. 37M]